MGAASGRGEQSYGVVTIALEKVIQIPRQVLGMINIFLQHNKERHTLMNFLVMQDNTQKLSLDSCIKTYFCALSRLS